MPKYRTPDGLEEHACIDRPCSTSWSISTGSGRGPKTRSPAPSASPGDVRDSLRRLRSSRLIHRWNDLAVASHPVVRFHEINHGPAMAQPR